jgi:hypothetical protein
MLHVYCKTEVAVLMLAVKDEAGVMRVPVSPGARAPGWEIAVRPLVPIGEQLVAAAAEALGTDVTGLALDVVQEFADETRLADGTLATVYLATLAPAVAERRHAPRTWSSIPELLRGLPKDRGRLPYLRAWQILTGGLQLNTKAVDVSELGKYFEE